jgi:hypothetical protein
LAEDETIRGTVVLDYYDHLIEQGLVEDYATGLQRAYEGWLGQRVGWAERSDQWLSQWIRQRLRSFADGARPITSLFTRALAHGVTQQYLVTFADRSRDADYQKVRMPDFYYGRALRHSGLTVPTSGPIGVKELDQFLLDSIRAFEPADTTRFLDNAQLLAGWVKAIRARGGEVIVLRMPVSGFVRLVDETRYPREQFFDQVGPITGAPLIHFADFPEMAGFICPDGSHLDFRDKRAFTQALAMQLAPLLPPSPK